MVLVAHLLHCHVQDRLCVTLLVIASAFLHSFNVMPCIIFFAEVEENTHTLRHRVAKCKGFDNCIFLDTFLLSLTRSRFDIEFSTIKLRVEFQLEPTLYLPSQNQDGLCSTADYVINHIKSRNPAQTNVCRRFPRVLEMIRSGVV